MLIQSLLYIPTIVTVLAVAWFIWRKNPTSLSHQIFAVFALLIAPWMVLLFLADISTDPARGLYFLRASRIFASPLAYLFFVFALLFPVKSNRYRLWSIIFAIPAVFFVATTFSPHYIAEVDVSGIATQPSQVGYINTMYFAYNIVYFALSFRILLRKMGGLSFLQKFQIKVIVLFTMSAGFTIMTVIFPHGNSLDKLAALASPSILVGAVAAMYAIFYFDLFDVRSLNYRSIIAVAPCLKISRDRTQVFFNIQTLAKEADAHNIALDFSGLKELDPDIARGIVNLRENLQSEFDKQVYFIGCAPGVRKLLSIDR